MRQNRPPRTEVIATGKNTSEPKPVAMTGEMIISAVPRSDFLNNGGIQLFG
jgi:hypothetical protein